MRFRSLYRLIFGDYSWMEELPELSSVLPPHRPILEEAEVALLP